MEDPMIVLLDPSQIADPKDERTRLMAAGFTVLFLKHKAWGQHPPITIVQPSVPLPPGAYGQYKDPRWEGLSSDAKEFALAIHGDT